MVGKTISHYKIIEKLGEGGMGTVYNVEDTTQERMSLLSSSQTGIRLVGQSQEHKINSVRQQSA